jgi:flagellar L-ring protein precursor FlgH
MRPFAFRPALAVAAAAALTACGASHIGTYQPKRREYEAPAPSEAFASASAGSLWPAGRAPTLLFADARALRENDLVVIKIEEIADATHGANTDIARTSNMSASVLASNGAAAAPIVDFKVNGGMDTAFLGKGSTGRTEQLVATVPAVVRKVLPNGNLFVEGHRVVLVNSEEQHFYISGVVRPIDIEQDNSVRSSKVADAEIEFTGRGIITDNQKQGWLSRYFGWIWPF